MPKTKSEFEDLFYRFKDLADKKHEIFDEDIINLVSNMIVKHSSINFEYMNVNTESGKKPNAHLVLNIDGELKEAKSEGDGAVDAAFNAIEKIVQSKSELLLYSVNNITSGTDAQGEVTVRIEATTGAARGAAAWAGAGVVGPGPVVVVVSAAAILGRGRLVAPLSALVALRVVAGGLAAGEGDDDDDGGGK